MAQITYTDKVALNENPEIADINKVTDDDMNEIKQVVNDNYNNTIQITDTEPTDSDNKLWIDTGEIAQAHTEITNSYSTSTGLGYSANYINNLNTYSTNEKRVGTWIDGKPLYRKTIIIENVVKGTATTYNHGIQNVDTIFIDANSFYKFSGGTPLANMLNNYQNIDKQMTRTVATSTIIEYYVGDYVVSGTTDGYITVYYTKTTD